MAEVVLSTVDLDVFAGPAALDVSVDYGKTGERGSQIWTGPGDPDIYLVGQPYQEFDWYIDSVSSQMYQYINLLGTLEWSPILYLSLPQRSLISSTSFTAGASTINIPLNTITSDSGVTTNEIVIRYNIQNATNPVSSTFSYSITGTYPSQTLAVTINAIEYSGGSWSNITGNKDVHLFISYTG